MFAQRLHGGSTMVPRRLHACYHTTAPRLLPHSTVPRLLLHEGHTPAVARQVAPEDISKNGGKVFAKAAATLPVEQPTLLAGLGLNAEARRYMQLYFSEAQYLSDLLTAQTRPLFEDTEGRITLAFELADTMVCAAADRFVGNLRTPFAAHVCQVRGAAWARGQGGNTGGVPATAAVADADGETASGPECRDIYNRLPQKGRLYL